MSIVEQARHGLRQLNAVLNSEGDDGRVRYLSVALDFDFDGELCRVRNLPAR